MTLNKIYKEKASLPRECRNATDLREALRHYVAKRLLVVADSCLSTENDIYRKEYGFIHRRYANTLTLITEAIQDVEYTTKSLITWMMDDYENALTGAQKDAAGLCAAELIMIVEKLTDADCLDDSAIDMPPPIRHNELMIRSAHYRESLKNKSAYRMAPPDDENGK